MEISEYQKMTHAGAEGLSFTKKCITNPVTHRCIGFWPKKNFEWQLDGLERAYKAGGFPVGLGWEPFMGCGNGGRRLLP